MIELNVTVELSHSKEHHYEEKSIWKKSLVFSLIAAMVLSLMPAEAFLTEVKADESYGNIVNSADSEEDGEGYEELIFSEWSEDVPKLIKDSGVGKKVRFKMMQK